MNWLKRNLILVGCALVFWVPVWAQDFVPPQLEQLAIQDKGRKKPLSTFTRETLQSLAGTTQWTDAQGKKWGADEAVLSMWLDPQPWLKLRVIAVGHKPLKEAVGLDRNEKRFSYDELSTNAAFQKLFGEARRMRATNPKAELNPLQQEAVKLAGKIGLFEDVVRGKAMTLVPHPQAPQGLWVSLESAPTYYPVEQLRPVAEKFVIFQEAFKARDAEKTGGAVTVLAEALRGLSPSVYPTAAELSFEHFYFAVHPFGWAWKFYLLAALMLGLTWNRPIKWGYAAGWVLMGAGLAAHLFGFGCRLWISGRAPVTNMYETVIWLAFGVVLFAMILEAVYRPRYFLLAAAPVAVLALGLADNAPGILDSSIQPLEAVLQNNFWLSTHVTSITLSYAAFALALGLGHAVLGQVVFRGRMPSAALYQYVYRAIQIGVLLLASGTILGGVWANYSWGRFWDWDPKETWALITLLGYLALLHGRLAGWWGGFGLAVGSILCFQSVLMAWYGVNFVLGKGLHSYGFGSGGLPYVATYVAAELIFVGIALTRKRAPRPSRPASAERAEATWAEV
jgi:cytochrome c-type biogenesis protein CcsB